jgi:hypothetical protein
VSPDIWLGATVRRNVVVERATRHTYMEERLDMATKKELLEEARSLRLKPVTRNSVAELEAMIAEATPKPKATGFKRAPKAADNPDVVKLIDGVGTGDFALTLEEAGLTMGGLARELGVASGPVHKVATGRRVPRPNASPDSIPGQVARWYVSRKAAVGEAS